MEIMKTISCLPLPIMMIYWNVQSLEKVSADNPTSTLCHNSLDLLFSYRKPAMLPKGLVVFPHTSILDPLGGLPSNPLILPISDDMYIIMYLYIITITYLYFYIEYIHIIYTYICIYICNIYTTSVINKYVLFENTYINISYIKYCDYRLGIRSVHY